MNIFFFGDSICFGQFVSPHNTWCSRISTDLAGLNESFTVINTSISGNTTRMALERMPYDVQAHGIDMIYIQFGMNDCNYWQSDKGLPRVSSDAFYANLCEIIDRSHVFGAKQILIATNHPPLPRDFSYTDVSYQNSNKQYNEIIRKVAGVRDVYLVDHEVHWQQLIKRGMKPEDLLLADGVHLSIRGHDVYYDFTSPTILRVAADIV